MEKSTIIGLTRDTLAAGLGLAVLFGLEITTLQVGAILTFSATVLALGTFIVAAAREKRRVSG